MLFQKKKNIRFVTDVGAKQIDIKKVEESLRKENISIFQKKEILSQLRKSQK